MSGVPSPYFILSVNKRTWWELGKFSVMGCYATFTESPAMRQSTRYGNRALPKGCPVSAEPVICRRLCWPSNFAPKETLPGAIQEPRSWVANGRSPHPSGDVPRAVANVVFQPKSMSALSRRRGERLQPPRPPFCLALGIYERPGDGAAHQHHDPAHEEAGVEPVERCRGALNNPAHEPLRSRCPTTPRGRRQATMRTRRGRSGRVSRRPSVKSNAQ